MATRGDTAEGSKLQLRAERLTCQLVDTAARYFGTSLAHPKVSFDLHGKSAGQARLSADSGCLVRYNVHLLNRYPQAFLSQTVPHESAHVVAFGLFGPRVSPHGEEWRRIMVFFGASPMRCHSYGMENLPTRRLRLYDYRCACRIHRLTSIRHNRIRSGQVYLCKKCGRPLEHEWIPASD